MSRESPRALVISDGGVAALLAVAYEGERWGGTGSQVGAGGAGGGTQAPLSWSGHVRGTQAAQAAAAASLYGLTHLAQPMQAIPEELGASTATSAMLLTAARLATLHGCDRVVWPIQIGAGESPDADQIDLDTVSRAVDRALLVSRLVALDAHEHGRPAVRIETPFADLADRQLAELAIDADLPMHLCWWWDEAADPRSADAAAERQRWLPALTAAGWRAPSAASST